MEKEIWKTAKGFEDYLVSNYGRVKHKKYQIIRKPQLRSGYLILNVWKNGRQYWRGVHRLVAMTFIPNPDNLEQVNHKDENKTNNYVGNLEWCTRQYNNSYGTGTQRSQATRKRNDPEFLTWKKAARTMRERNRKCGAKSVEQYDLEGNLIATYYSQCEAAEAVGSFASNINMCCKGKRKTVKGYIWKYKASDND